MFLAATILIVLLSLKLSHAVVTRFGGSKGFWGELTADKPSIWSRLFAVGGCLLMLGSGLAAIERTMFVLTAERAAGRIVEMAASRDADGQVFYRPRFSFQDKAGREFTIESSVGTGPDEFTPGEQITVLYSSAAESAAVIYSYVQVWGVCSILAVIGSVLLAGGTVRLYWPKIANHFEKAPAPMGWWQKLSRNLFRLADNFFAMPGTLRFGTFACAMLAFGLSYIILTVSNAEDDKLELAALAGIALILAGGLLCRSRWARPVGALTALMMFLNNYADKFWPIALIIFIAQVVVPIGYLYFNPAVKAYFNREQPKPDASGGSSFEFNDSVGKDVAG